MREWLLSTLSDPLPVLEQLEFYFQQESDKLEQRDRQVRRLEARLDGLGVEELRILEWTRKGYIDETIMLAQLDQVRAERQAVRQQLENLAAENYDARRDPRLLTPKLKQWLAKHLKIMPPDGTVPEFLRRLAKIVWLEPDGGVTIEGTLPVVDNVYPRS